MSRSLGSLLALCLVLVLGLVLVRAACGGGEKRSGGVPLPGESSGALANEPLPETPPALSPAEQEPGKPIDLGDGLILQVDRAGSGKIAHVGSRVQLQYEAKIKDTETVVATTEGWDTPLSTTLGGGAGGPQLLHALERALTGLRAGCSATLEVPSALGYGKQGPAGTEDKALVFQIELVGVDG
jgi:FKBP-type peptidyl-prolyl cis-trans isomerase